MVCNRSCRDSDVAGLLWPDENDGDVSPEEEESSVSKKFGDLPTDAFGLSVRATLESSGEEEALFDSRKPLGVSAVVDSQNV